MEKRIRILENDKYLVIPIKAEQEKTQVLLLVDNIVTSEFNIPIGSGENEYSYDYLAYIPIIDYLGKEICLRGELPVNFINSIFTTETLKINRNERPLIHFTPDYGWINDPNGLVYLDGLYHMYFQYNPFDTKWDNMSWGHAVSKDLLHWEQKDTTLLPDEDGMIFSGCGLVNEQGLLGLPKDALLFFYSAAGNSNELSKGKEFVQKLAYSLDNGTSLIKKQTILPTICKENRDPKIFWHEASKAYIMCLWLEENDFAILRSPDLENWEESQRFTLDKGFECPDLFELEIETSKETNQNTKSKWVFWCADGYYYLGDFDGYEFLTDGVRKEAYMTQIPYAAQTISNVGNRVISIPWFRTKTVNNLYTGCMGIPREFSLLEYKNGLRLKQSLVHSIEKQQELVFEKGKEGIQSGKIRLDWNRNGAIKIDIKFGANFKELQSNLNCNILGVNISYNVTSGTLKVADEETIMKDRVKDFCIIYDKGIIEITANNGIIYAVFEVTCLSVKEEIEITSDSIAEIKVFEIL
jgi:sucrose-6-phosphate hydrolase SacC (GH32 family)